MKTRMHCYGEVHLDQGSLSLIWVWSFLSFSEVGDLLQTPLNLFLLTFTYPRRGREWSGRGMFG